MLTATVEALIMDIDDLTATVNKSTATDPELAADIERLKEGVNGLWDEVANMTINCSQAAAEDPALLQRAYFALKDWNLPGDDPLKDQKRRKIMRSLLNLYMKSLVEAVNIADSKPPQLYTVEEASEEGK